VALGNRHVQAYGQHLQPFLQDGYAGAVPRHHAAWLAHLLSESASEFESERKMCIPKDPRTWTLDLRDAYFHLHIPQIYLLSLARPGLPIHSATLRPPFKPVHLYQVNETGPDTCPLHLYSVDELHRRFCLRSASRSQPSSRFSGRSAARKLRPARGTGKVHIARLRLTGTGSICRYAEQSAWYQEIPLQAGWGYTLPQGGHIIASAAGRWSTTLKNWHINIRELSVPLIMIQQCPNLIRNRQSFIS